MKTRTTKTLLLAGLAAAAFQCSVPTDMENGLFRHTLAASVESTQEAPVGSDTVAPDPRIEKAVTWALGIADNQKHGYSQGAENATSRNPYTGSREGLDYDCSSLVYHALQHGGFPIIEAWHKNPDFQKLYQGKQYTGDADTVWPDLKAIGGFSKYSWDSVKDHLMRGDLLCDPEHHIAIYIGNGQTVEARGVENPRGGDWKTGDQGGEIDLYSAYGRSWTEVYRYTGNKK